MKSSIAILSQTTYSLISKATSRLLTSDCQESLRVGMNWRWLVELERSFTKLQKWLTMNMTKGVMSGVLALFSTSSSLAFLGKKELRAKFSTETLLSRKELSNYPFQIGIPYGSDFSRRCWHLITEKERTRRTFWQNTWNGINKLREN